MAAIASSSSSYVPNSCKYDVFLSFRGEDTRRNFTSHLYTALCREKILAYIDDNLERGEEISSSLLTTIEESKLSIVVFSKNYASSRWCLDELVRIMECKKEKEHIVLPVFYGVDPSDVRNQKGSYADAFIKHEERYKDTINKVQIWRNAVTASANLSGFDSQNESSMPESKLVEKVVKEVLEKLYSISEITTEDFTGLVGMNKRLAKMESLLSVGYPDVRIIGIWGMGGIGKTTLAEIMFKRLYSRFDSCFFAAVREGSNEDELRHLKEKMFSTLLKDTNPDHMHSSFANDRLRRKRVLVVLDNVSKLKQLERLLGIHVPFGVSQQRKDLFGVGSRIILTSRDRKLLTTRADEIYEVEALNSNEALKLFCWKAFGGDSPMTDFVELSEKIVHYTKGNPLALDVLGSHLHSRSLREWESALVELEKAPNKDILEVLKISYDALDDGKKAIFLDIACFLIGEDRDLAEEILGVESHIGINILVEKSLISIRHGQLSIHDLLQEMAFEIDKRESKEVGQHSRLCNPQDVYHILQNNRGTATIEGILLDVCKIHEDLRLRSTVFVDMCNMRFLKIHKSYIFGDCKFLYVHCWLRYLPHSLRYLEWSEFPLKSLPSKFEPHNLIRLHMTHSGLKELWKGVKHLGNLKAINLSYSKRLIKLPDLSQAPKLEDLILTGCTSLRHLPSMSVSIKNLHLENSGIEALPSSFESLENIVMLRLCYCKHLKSLPKLPKNTEFLDLTWCAWLESLPSNIWKLKSLRYFDLSFCLELKIIPEISEAMESLTTLILGGREIEELDLSIENLTGLRNLDLGGCENLRFIPKGLITLSHLSFLNLNSCSNLRCFPSTILELNITCLDLGFCNIQEIPDSLGSLSTLTKMYLSGNKFETIPSSIIQLDKLHYLCISYCKNLRHLPELPSSIKVVDANECGLLETVDTLKAFQVKEQQSNSLEEVKFLFCYCWELKQSARDNILIYFLSRVYNYIAPTTDDISFEMLEQIGSHGMAGFDFSSRVYDLLATKKEDIVFQTEACRIRHLNFFARAYDHLASRKEDISVRDYFDGIKACYPGNKVPKWFKNREKGSSASIELPPNWLNNNFLGFATCVALKIRTFELNNILEIVTVLRFKTNHGEKYYRCMVLFTDCYDGDSEENMLKSFDHVFMWYKYDPNIKFDLMNLDVTEASFDIVSMLDGENIKVRSCGIRMIYRQEAEEEWPILKEIIPGRHDCTSDANSEDYSRSSLISELHEEQLDPSGDESQTSETETFKSAMEEFQASGTEDILLVQITTEEHCMQIATLFEICGSCFSPN